MRRPHGGVVRSLDLEGGWTIVRLVLQGVSGKSLARMSWAAGLDWVRMSESVMWTGSGPLGGSQPGVVRPPVSTGVEGGLSGTLSLHQGRKPTKTASRVSFMYKPSQGPQGWGRPQGNERKQRRVEVSEISQGTGHFNYPHETVFL